MIFFVRSKRIPFKKKDSTQNINHIFIYFSFFLPRSEESIFLALIKSQKRSTKNRDPETASTTRAPSPLHVLSAIFHARADE